MSWISYPETCDFPLENLPYGVFLSPSGPHICTAIGSFILDLNVLAKVGLFSKESTEALQKPTLNDFMSLGKQEWSNTRKSIKGLLETGCEIIKGNEGLKMECLVPMTEVKMVLPATIGDYTDFYSSRYHAYNVGVMFRGPENALQPNWLHLPVGYHGRASSVVVSGTEITRPMGQLCADEKDPKPSFGPCALLDFELEIAFYVGTGNAMGTRIPVDQADDRIFGISLMNDWSARDIQKWEYVPLGPFNAKNFATTVSPWIVTMEALEPFKVMHSTQEPAVLPYLLDKNLHGYDINLEVAISTDKFSTIVSKSNGNYLYWSFSQQLAHHTSTGCPMKTGDMCGSGTISGPDVGSYGSMLEISWRGTKPVPMPDGSERKFLKDGDTVTISGYCQGNGYRIGFGLCAGRINPAILNARTETDFRLEDLK